jgi:hypothetical protein
VSESTAEFLERWDVLAADLHERMLSAFEREEEWVDGMRSALAAAAECIAAEPEAAAEGFLAVNEHGKEGRGHRDAAIASLARLIERGEEEAAPIAVPTSTAFALAGAVYGMVSVRLARGRAAAIPGVIPEVMFAIVLPYRGHDAATAELERGGE